MRATTAWLAAVLAVAAAVRLPRVLGDDFPINDGGLFFVMADELSAAHLRLPATTAYNGASMSFAYPPLGMETAAAIHLATGAGMLELFRFLPLLANLITAAVVFVVARRLLRKPSHAGLAALTFVLLPRSYEYLIMGGGLTRSFGFLFACLAVGSAHRLFVDRRGSAAWTTAAALALAALSHPEMGVWAGVSVAAVVLTSRLDRWTIVRCAYVAVGAVVLTAPWWLTVIGHHGIAPFLAASHTSGWRPGSLLGLLGRAPTGEVGLAPVAMLGWIGFLDALWRRDLFLPLWVAATFLAVPRSAPSMAVVPFAILATRALAGFVLPRLERILPSRAGAPSRSGSPGAPLVPRRRRALLGAAVVVPVLAYTLVFGNLRRTPESWPSMRKVPPGERAAMAWVAAHVPPGSRFAVASTVSSWWVDAVDSWFPALTGMVNVASPNGAEWLPGGEFARRLEAYRELRRCARLEAPCLDAWSARFGMAFSHLYVSKGGAQPAADRAVRALAGAGFTVVYDAPAAAVLARRPGPEGTATRGP